MKWFDIKHFVVQFLRRCIQLGIVLLMVGLGYKGLYDHYRAARALDDIEGARGCVMRAMDRSINKLDDPQAFLDSTYGTIWSMKLGWLEWTDPLAVVEPTVASKKIYIPLLLSVIAPVLLTVLFGKVFCSWLCPAYLLFEISGKMRRVLRFAELSPAEVRFSRNNKYFFLTAGLIIAAIIGLPFFTLIYPPAVVNRLIHAWIYGTAFTGLAILLAPIIIFELLVSPRWWCRTMCPGGALYALLGKFRLVKIKLKPTRCTGCGMCRPVCEAGLDPVKESCSIECDNCGVCVRRCPEKALTFTCSTPLASGETPNRTEKTVG